jgi:hypothetical protein
MRHFTFAALVACSTMLSPAAFAIDGTVSTDLKSELADSLSNQLATETGKASDAGSSLADTITAPPIADSASPLKTQPEATMTTTVETTKETAAQATEAPVAEATKEPGAKTEELRKETTSTVTTIETTKRTILKEGDEAKTPPAQTNKAVASGDFPPPVKLYPGSYTGQPSEASQEAVLWLISEARYHMLTGDKEKAAKSLTNASNTMFELSRRNEIGGSSNAVRALYISYAIGQNSIGLVVPLFGNSSQASVGSWDSVSENPELTDLQAILVNLRFNNMLAADIKEALAKVNASDLTGANELLSKAQERDLRYFYFSSVGYDKAYLALETAENLARADAFAEVKRLLTQVKGTVDKMTQSPGDRELEESLKSFKEKLDAALADETPSAESIASLREQWSKWSHHKGKFGDK